jgi:hypothetical protein
MSYNVEISRAIGLTPPGRLDRAKLGVEGSGTYDHVFIDLARSGTNSSEAVAEREASAVEIGEQLDISAVGYPITHSE